MRDIHSRLYRQVNFSRSAYHPDFCEKLHLPGRYTLSSTVSIHAFVPLTFFALVCLIDAFPRLSLLHTFLFPYTLSVLLRYILRFTPCLSFSRRFFNSFYLASTDGSFCCLFPLAVSVVVAASVSSVYSRSIFILCFCTHFVVFPLSLDSPPIFHLLDLISPRFNYQTSVSVSPILSAIVLFLLV